MSTSFKVNCSTQRPSIPHRFDQFKTLLSSSVKLLINKKQPFWRELKGVPLHMDVKRTMKNTSVDLLNAFVDLVFEFSSQPLLPSQSNFSPVEKIGEATHVNIVDGKIPVDFPEGVYIRNGPNPLFGGLQTANSIFGRSSHIWVEGEGMLHALYFKKNNGGKWTIIYNNKQVETDTLKLEKARMKPLFIPTVEGNPTATISAYVLNMLRFGKVNKCTSNTNVFHHAGKMYSIAENDLPQEIDIHTLENIGSWDVAGAWDRPFTSHPKRAPGTNELVAMGFDAVKPFFQLGVVSADGRRLIHKADLKFERCTLSHEIGVTERYNVILDFPVTIEINRLIGGGSLIKFDEKAYARIGVMPRYGDAESVRWFKVETCSAFHIINCFEDEDEVIMMGCRARGSIIPGPEFGLDKHDWFSRGFKHINLVEKNGENSTHDGSLFARAYEWRLNMYTGEVKEKYLTGTKSAMDFPMINESFTGVRNKYGYTQLVDSQASSISGMAKYGGLAKLYLEESEIECSSGEKLTEEIIRVEYHMFPKNTFCTGSTFVPKHGGLDEDDGWIITYVHDEDTDISLVYIVDTKKFTDEPLVKITMPRRVPYGFHGSFVPISP